VQSICMCCIYVYSMCVQPLTLIETTVHGRRRRRSGVLCIIQCGSK